MAKKTEYRYTYHVTKRYVSSSDVYSDEYFDLSIKLPEFDLGSASYKAKKLVEEKGCSTSSYKYSVSLASVEEL